jgi:CheY-like chemotaxis protein
MTGSTARRRILVAEDNQAHQLVLRRVMRDVRPGAPPDLSFVDNGQELIDHLAAAEAAAPSPDVILLDLHMPGLSGMETLRILRDDERWRAIPVVILSSSDQAKHIDEAYLGGANAYLVKLGDRAELTEQMRRFAEFWLDTALLPGRHA